MTILKETGRVQIYEVIKDSIQYLELMPGSIIREQELASQIGVSRTPIREALIRLAADFLIDIYPQKGTYVAKIDFGLAQEIAYMRHILDMDICLKLCGNKAKIKEFLSDNFYFMSNAVKKGHVQEYIINDNEFHRSIFNYAGHKIIWGFISDSRAHYNRVLMLDLRRPHMLEKSLEEHHQLVDYIESGNKTKLREILERHHDHNNIIKLSHELKTLFPAYFPEG
jgi:DNA-binding GntR family transcriptional regulator